MAWCLVKYKDFTCENMNCWQLRQSTPFEGAATSNTRLSITRLGTSKTWQDLTLEMGYCNYCTYRWKGCYKRKKNTHAITSCMYWICAYLNCLYKHSLGHCALRGWNLNSKDFIYNLYTSLQHITISYSCEQPTMDGPPAWGLSEGGRHPHREKSASYKTLHRVP